MCVCVCVCVRAVTTNSVRVTVRHLHCRSFPFTEKGFCLEALIDSASQRTYHLVMAVDSSPPCSQQPTMDPMAQTASSRHIHRQLMCQQVAVCCGPVRQTLHTPVTRHACNTQCTSHRLHISSFYVPTYSRDIIEQTDCYFVLM